MIRSYYEIYLFKYYAVTYPVTGNPYRHSSGKNYSIYR